MKIVIEGMDGVGKSTVAKEVARRLNAKYVDGLLMNFLREGGLTEPELKTVKRAIDIIADNECSILRTWIYGYANLFNLLHYEGDLVIDRHCITTFYFNGDKDSDVVFNFMQKLAGKPDFVIILRATPQTRITRILDRNKQDPDLSSEYKMAYGYDKMEEAAKHLSLNFKIIDTDDKDIPQIVEEVIAYVKE